MQLGHLAIVCLVFAGLADGLDNYRVACCFCIFLHHSSMLLTATIPAFRNSRAASPRVIDFSSARPSMARRCAGVSFIAKLMEYFTGRIVPNWI